MDCLRRKRANRISEPGDGTDRGCLSAAPGRSAPFLVAARTLGPRCRATFSVVLPNLQLVFQRVNQLRADGVIEQYAIGGAWAVTYFSEPVPTEDVDVFCHLPGQGALISLSPVYSALHDLGYAPAAGTHADSVLIEGVPVQFLVGNPLVDEAIAQAIEVDLMGERIRIFDLEYVLAIALDVGRAKDRARIGIMLEATNRPIDHQRLESILGRHAPGKPRPGEVTLLDRWSQREAAR